LFWQATFTAQEQPQITKCLLYAIAQLFLCFRTKTRPL